MLYTHSYYFYIATIVVSCTFAWLAEVLPTGHGATRRPNPLFWWLSLLTLWFVMGFRQEIGVDYFNYQRTYENIAANGVAGFYLGGGRTEPGYVLLLYLVSLIYGKFDGVFICTSFIGLFLLYRAFAFEYGRMSLICAILIFSTTQYFYFFGIDRLFLAVSIVTHGFHFIVQGRRKKYLVSVALASLFHISASCMLFLPYLYTFDHNRTKFLPKDGILYQPTIKWPRYIFILCLSPLIFYMLTLVIPYLPDRYHNYVGNVNFYSGFSSVIIKLPIALALLLCLKKTLIYCQHSIIYVSLYFASLFVQIFSGIAGVSRVGWYFWVSLCFALPMTLRGIKKDKLLYAGLMIFILIYCTGYFCHAYLNVDSPRFDMMFPYRNIFFDL